jgi:methylamine dehydrogenase accessory protein MauD
MDPLVLSNGLLWLLVIALAVTVLALARQVGILHERIAPAGALMLGSSLGVGDPAPELSLASLTGGDVQVGGVREDGRSTLLFFLSPICPVCDTLLPVLRSVRKGESKWLDVVLASDGDEPEHRAFLDAKNLEAFPYLLSRDLGIRFEVAKLPYAALIDEAGILRGKGLVNSREHLESLFEAMERGVPSIAEFMKKETRDDLRVA